MLLDFVNLAPGDWVVQNGANSAVGYFIAFQDLILDDDQAISYFCNHLSVGRAGSDSNCQDNGGENCQCSKR